MVSKKDLRVIMLYEFKRGTNAAKTAQSINEAFEETFINATTVQRWFKKFREGNENLENEDRGRPSTIVDDDELRAIVEANPRATLRELANILNASKTTISNHLQKIRKAKRLEKKSAS